jgi:GTP pyrophosphokinase
MKDAQKPLIDEALIRTDYEKSLPALLELEQESVFILERSLKKDQVKIHSLTHRIKEFPSFIEKCKRINFKDPLREMQDLVGLRVVCLYLSDIQKVLSIVNREFDFVREADTIGGTDVSSFGYMSHHVIVQMKSTHRGPRYDSVLGKLIEIQIRTILMDAWANVSHHLQYKNDSDVPTELLRDFHALSGLFYVADTHFEIFFRATQQSRKKIDELFRTTEPQRIEEEINLDTVKAYLANKFPGREQPTADELSLLVTELKSSQYKTIAQIDENVERTRAALFKIEEDVVSEYKQMDSELFDALPSQIKKLVNSGGHFYSATGMVRVALMIIDPEFLETAVSSWGVDEQTKQNALIRYSGYRENLYKK